MSNQLDHFLQGAESADLWALSGTEMLKDLGLSPDPWQMQVMRGNFRRALLNCSRQSGKSTTTAGLALHHALFPPEGKPTLTLLLSPSLRQSSELFRKVLTFYRKLNRPEPAVQESRLELELANGSRIVSLPSSEETVRGYSGVSLLIIDEAARVPDSLYKAVRPMLATSNGRLLCLSTPYGKRGFFHDAWFSPDKWERIRITCDDCPRISQEFLEEEKRALGETWFNQEYRCDFSQIEGLVWPEFANCVVEPCDVKPIRCGAGCDYGFNNPSAVIFGMLDKDDVLWLFAEVYGTRMTDDDLARKIQPICRQHQVELIWCDSEAPGSIEKFRRSDLPAAPAMKARESGIRAVAERLRTGRLKCFSTLKHTIREAGLFRYYSADEKTRTTDDTVPENDHAMDAIRYLIAGLDRVKPAQGVERRQLEPEPPPAVDYERDYTKAPPKEPPRRLTVEERFDRSEESRRLNREHLEDTFESWRGFDGASGP